RHIVLPECSRLRRKHLQDPDHFVRSLYRAGDDRTNAQRAATLAIDAGIIFCVVANDGSPCPDTLPAESGVTVEACPYLWRIATTSCPANHLRRIEAIDQRDGSAACPGEG